MAATFAVVGGILPAESPALGPAGAVLLAAFLTGLWSAGMHRTRGIAGPSASGAGSERQRRDREKTPGIDR